MYFSRRIIVGRRGGGEKNPGKTPFRRVKVLSYTSLDNRIYSHSPLKMGI
jgi:hypothetical protein